MEWQVRFKKLLLVSGGWEVPKPKMTTGRKGTNFLSSWEPQKAVSNSELYSLVPK